MQARNLSSLSLLAGGHDISVVLELAVIQDDSVGRAGLGTAVAAGARSVASRYIVPGAALPACARPFPSRILLPKPFGVLFLRAEFLAIRGRSNKHSDVSVMCPAAD